MGNADSTQTKGFDMRKHVIACAFSLCIAVAISGCSGAASTVASTSGSNGTDSVSASAQVPSDAHTVVAALEAKGLSITTMESCTSGLIASSITDTEGASAIFPGGYVTYSNEAKVKAGVDAGVIDTYGVYSAQCAEAMARAAQSSFGTDIAIGITGTTGNVDANNKDSVKGEVYYCIVLDGEAHPYHLQMDVDGMSRNQIKQAYVDDVFRELGKLIA